MITAKYLAANAEYESICAIAYAGEKTPNGAKREMLNLKRLKIYREIEDALMKKYPSGEIEGYWVTTQSSCFFHINHEASIAHAARNYPYGRVEKGILMVKQGGHFMGDIIRVAMANGL